MSLKVVWTAFFCLKLLNFRCRRYMYCALVQTLIPQFFDDGIFVGNYRQLLIIFASGGLYYPKTESNAEQAYIIFI